MSGDLVFGSSSERARVPNRAAGGRARPDRKFGLLDGMMLICATALGMGLLRILLSDVPSDAIELGTIADAVEIASIFGVPILGVWSLAFVVIRLRRPRPAFRQLMREPGFVATSIATILFLASTAIAAELHFIGAAETEFVVFLSPLQVGPSIAITWCFYWRAGWCRRGRGWIDRAGRLLGWVWIVAGVACAWLAWRMR